MKVVNRCLEESGCFAMMENSMQLSEYSACGSRCTELVRWNDTDGSCRTWPTMGCGSSCRVDS